MPPKNLCNQHMRFRGRRTPYHFLYQVLDPQIFDISKEFSIDNLCFKVCYEVFVVSYGTVNDELSRSGLHVVIKFGLRCVLFNLACA